MRRIAVGPRLARKLIPALIALLLNCTAAAAQQPAGESSDRKRVTALRIAEPIVVDGALQEPAWERAIPATDFVQQQPHEGQAARRATEVRFLYDESTLYVGAVLFDEAPERAITNELKRDFDSRNSDVLGVVLDTFLDGRTSYGFFTNPGGAQHDTLAYDNGQRSDSSWNAVWFVKTSVQERGWTVEASIPFKTLRFPERDAHRWGLNIVRIVRRENEVAMWSPVPRQFTQHHVGYAGELVGITDVRSGHHLRVTPFTTAQADRGLTETDWDAKADGGFDLKWSVTPALVLDATLRTDFAQVEADAQQINLTRFSLLFPEKRQFFLESPGSFQIGLAGPEGGPAGNMLVPFFTRRIGLSEAGTPIAVLGGLRLTGQSGGNTIGILNMQTGRDGDRPGDNFSVVRLSREIRRRVAVGAFYFGREADGDGGPSLGNHNRVAGADFRFSPSRTLEMEALAMRSTSDGPDDDVAGRTRVRLRGKSHTATVDFLHVGEHFRHDLGFLRRRGIGMFFGDYARTFRPDRTQRWAREHALRMESQTILDSGYTQPLTRINRAHYTIGFADGGDFRFTYEHNWERLLAPFDLRRGHTITPGDYGFDEIVFVYNSDRSSPLSTQIQINLGDFWTGTRRHGKVGLRWRLNAHLAASAEYDREHITLATGAFTEDVAAIRANWSLNTRMFVDAFVQYNGARDTWLSNIRFNLIHRPLSDIYVVWNEGRGSGLSSRGLILKYTHTVGL